MKLDALVATLRADVVSGAAVVGRRAAELVRRTSAGYPGTDLAGYRRLLVDLALRLLDAQPAMAPLVSLSASVLRAADTAGTVEDGRHGVVGAAEGFVRALDEGARAVAVSARPLLPTGVTALTLSSSSTVRTTLEQAAGSSSLSVVCLEGRPGCEGQRLAGALATRGVQVIYAVDAAADSLVAGVDVVLLGTDAVGDRGFVNKIGSRAVISAATRARVPVYVLADRTKLLPPGFPQPTEDDRPGDEVWRAPSGVRVWNRYFEAVPLDDLAGIVTEDGILETESVEAARQRLEVPPELARWADSRQAAAREGPDPDRRGNHRR